MQFQTEQHFAKYIQTLGGQAWLVGGAVRDQLLNIECTDKDYFITGLPPEDLPVERIAGSQFPVFLIKISNQICEIALARTERKISIGHKGFEFNTNKNITAKEDLARRDLTINSMAINLLSGELLDPFNGQVDLTAHIIRHTTAAFSEDPLRVYRAARFAARFNFSIDPNTLVLMQSLKHELSSLASERILLELEKCFKSPNSSIFFEALKQCQCLDAHFEHIAALDDKRFALLMQRIDHCMTPVSKWLHVCYALTNKAEAFAKQLKANNRDKKLANLSTLLSDFITFEQQPTQNQWQLLSSLKSERTPLFDSLSILTTPHQIASIQTGFKYFDEINQTITAKALIKQGLTPGPALGNTLLTQRLAAFEKAINQTHKTIKEGNS